MKARWLVPLLVLVGCSDDDRQSQLRDHVQLFCRNVASDLRFALDDLKKPAAPAAGQPADSELPRFLMDNNLRGERVHDLQGRFGFCLAVRKADDLTKARLEHKYVELLGTLRGNVVGPAPSYRVSLETLEGLESTAREIEALPLRD